MSLRVVTILIEGLNSDELKIVHELTKPKHISDNWEQDLRLKLRIELPILMKRKPRTRQGIQ